MAASRIGFIIFVLAIFPGKYSAKDASSANIDKVLTAMEKLVKYYEKNFKMMNLDGLFGLRVVEGQLRMILDEHKSAKLKHIPEKVIIRLYKIYYLTKQVSNDAIPHLRNVDEHYFESMKLLIEKPWKFKGKHKLIDEKLQWKSDMLVKDRISEELSDRCMTELLGTRSGKKCDLSYYCLKIMTNTRGYHEYSVTHQLLFTMLANQMGCDSMIDHWHKTSGNKIGLQHMQLEFCTNDYYDMLNMVASHQGIIGKNDQDLFLEIQFVCPNLGFLQFLSLTWLKKILAWQKPSGCYGDLPPEDQDDGSEENHGGAVLEPNSAKHVVNINTNQGTENAHKVVKRKMNPNMLDSKNIQKFAQQGQGQFVNYLKRLPADPHIAKVIKTEQQKRFVDTQNGVNLMNPSVFPIAQSQNVKTSLTSNKHLPDIKNSQLTSKNLKLINKKASHPRKMRKKQKRHAVKNVGRKLQSFQPLLLESAESRWSSRKLLVELELPDGCGSHKTGVAAGALVMYMQYLLDPGPPEFAQFHLEKQKDFYIPNNIVDMMKSSRQVPVVTPVVKTGNVVTKNVPEMTKKPLMPAKLVKKEHSPKLSDTNAVHVHNVNSEEKGDKANDLEDGEDGNDDTLDNGDVNLDGENKDETEDAKTREKEYGKYQEDDERDDEGRDYKKDDLKVDNYDDIEENAGHKNSHDKIDVDFYNGEKADMVRGKVLGHVAKQPELHLIDKSVSNTSTAYFYNTFLIVVSFLVLFGMYRFVRRRKIGSRHRKM